MLRSGNGLALGLLALSLGFSACAEDVEDPGFTASAGGTAQATGTDGADTDTATDSATSMATADTADSTSNTAGEESSGGNTTGATTGMATTGPATTGQTGCGDGVVSPGEQCDGADLQDFTCESLGLGTGTLACDPVMCTFDTSMCESTTSGTSG